MEDDLVAWGRTLRLETRGRVTGRTASAVVGFVERPDGTLLVAAGSPDAGTFAYGGPGWSFLAGPF